MKKNWVWIVVVIVVILAAGGYFERHAIKAMFGMAPAPQPTVETQAQPTSASASNSAMAPSDNIYKTATDATKGKYMTDFQGMTLYTYDKDTAGVSNCADQCAVAWPVYTSGATAEKVLPTNITVITRNDGSKQFAWKGMPLYYFASDKKAGDINGDGVGGVWHIVAM